MYLVLDSDDILLTEKSKINFKNQLMCLKFYSFLQFDHFFKLGSFSQNQRGHRSYLLALRRFRPEDDADRWQGLLPSDILIVYDFIDDSF